MRRPAGAVIVIALLVLPLAEARSQGGPPGVRSLRFPISQHDGSLTPYTFESGYSLMTLIYDTLMWRDEEGNPQPWLARSVSTSPNGRTVTLKMREAVRWHDGRPLTSADVVFTFDHVREHYHPRFSPQLAVVRQVKAPDRSTVVIELEHVSPGFEDQPLADLPILPTHLWEGLPVGAEAPEGLPVGSGPYRLVSSDPDRGYRFVANDDYFLGRPLVRTLQVPLEDSFADTLDLIRDGDVDMVPVPLPEGHAQTLEGLSVALERGSLYSGTVLMFNLRRAPFDDPALRRAVGSALNLGGIARAAGDALPADFGYLHPESEWAPSESLHSYDPDAARSALESFDVRPFEVLAPDNNPSAIVAGRQVVLGLQEVGLDVEFRRLRPDALAAAVGQDGATPDFDAAIWPAPALASYDPDFLRSLFGSDPDISRLNYSGYRRPDLDAVAAKVASTIDPSRRRDHVAKELEILAEDLPHIPLFFSNGAFAYRPGTFDEWVFVAGTGILDKRSFLPQGQASPSPTASERAGAAPASPQGAGNPATGEGPSPIRIAALLLVVVAILLGGAAIYLRRG